MLNRLVTAVAIVAGGVAAYYTTRFGGVLIASQLADPLLGGVLWPVLLGVIWVSVLVLVTAAAGFVVQFIDSYGRNSIAGYDAYRLLSVTELCGTAAAWLPTADILLHTPVLPLKTGSLTPLISYAVVATPVSLIACGLWIGDINWSTDDTKNNSELDPEYVRQRTKRGEFEGVATGVPAVDKRERGNSTDSGQQAADLTEYEFNWQPTTGVRFDDIGGFNDIKRELQRNVILPLQNTNRAAKLGITSSNVIFHGPPGTGKTYFTKALATELELPTVILSGSDINSKWINESAERVQTLFSEAHKIAAAEGGAIIFIDEIDSVLKKRTSQGNSHTEDTKVVNEFLNHLEQTENDIVVVGATNRFESLDEAAIRPGRFDKKIEVGEPNQEEREAILHTQLKNRAHKLPSELVTQLAAESEGCVAAELEQLVTRAAKRALQREDNVIRPADIVSAMPT